ncbi:MAG: hypothetical protein KQJ78_24535 [Deltaproteobacteria bacterium]|nr:hypothetical protein [Deltaproteobacteria bacterium]
MNEILQIFVILGILALAFVGGRRLAMFMMRRAGNRILADLKARGALKPESAVEASYATRNWLHLGLRDYRPQMLEALLAQGVVGRTKGGKFYLLNPDFKL